MSHPCDNDDIAAAVAACVLPPMPMPEEQEDLDAGNPMHLPVLSRTYGSEGSSSGGVARMYSMPAIPVSRYSAANRKTSQMWGNNMGIIDETKETTDNFDGLEPCQTLDDDEYMNVGGVPGMLEGLETMYTEYEYPMESSASPYSVAFTGTEAPASPMSPQSNVAGVQVNPFQGQNSYANQDEAYNFCIKGSNFFGQGTVCRCRNCYDEARTPQMPQMPLWSDMQASRDTWVDTDNVMGNNYFPNAAKHRDTGRVSTSVPWGAQNTNNTSGISESTMSSPRNNRTSTQGSNGVSRKVSRSKVNKPISREAAQPQDYQDTSQFLDFLRKTAAREEPEEAGRDTQVAGALNQQYSTGQSGYSTGLSSGNNRSQLSNGQESRASASPRSRNKKKREPKEDEKTTSMLRNIPNKYEQQQLLDVMASKGFPTSTFDFFYLPIDFRNRCCVGYAFINFHTNQLALDFEKAFSGFKLPMTNVSPKICQVNFARIQGKQANLDVYRNSALAGVPIKEYRPLCFDNYGNEIALPTPDVPLPTVQLRAAKIHRGSKRKREKAKKMGWSLEALTEPVSGAVGAAC